MHNYLFALRLLNSMFFFIQVYIFLKILNSCIVVVNGHATSTPMVPAGQSMLVRAPHWRPPTSLSDWPAENSRLWPAQAETQNRTVAPQSGANFSLTSCNNNIGQQKNDNSSTTRAPHVTMTSSVFQDVKFSDRHNALYLYFSRLMGLVEFYGEFLSCDVILLWNLQDIFGCPTLLLIGQ